MPSFAYLAYFSLDHLAYPSVVYAGDQKETKLVGVSEPFPSRWCQIRYLGVIITLLLGERLVFNPRTL